MSITQKTFEYTQLNTGAIEEVFPLLCPVREKDWLDGWDYKMVHSLSGLIEHNCVFTTINPKKIETIWHVTQYDRINYKIEFLRVAPNENTVKINIHLEPKNEIITKALIKYTYTFLQKNITIKMIDATEKSFKKSMDWWEKSINYYLKTEKMLLKANDN